MADTWQPDASLALLKFKQVEKTIADHAVALQQPPAVLARALTLLQYHSTEI